MFFVMAVQIEYNKILQILHSLVITKIVQQGIFLFHYLYSIYPTLSNKPIQLQLTYPQKNVRQQGQAIIDLCIYKSNLQSMNRLISEQPSEHIDIHDSNPMDLQQQAIFLRLNHTKSNDSFLGRLLPQHSEVPQRSLIFDFVPTNFINNVVLNREKSAADVPKQEKTVSAQNGGLHIFKKVKKEKVRNKCDYDKNICGYITKKVIREFVSSQYQKQVNELVRKYHSNYEQCKLFYLKKVQLVTGPSHLPQLFESSPNETQSIASYKKVFKKFYRWFLKQRYLRYLLVQGKMADKHAYIEYKNNHMFRYVQQSESQGDEEMEYRVLTRSKSILKLEGEGF